ncbi:MAG: lamin tail domain-containing protein, partial [bacterium]
MKKLIFLLLGIPSLIYAQVYDGFDDGDFTEDPEWSGDTQKFIVNENLELQLYDTAASMAYLCTPNFNQEEAEWRFRIRLAFSPSANNYARFYLSSNREDLAQPLVGYFLQFGESGSNDAIELFRQEGEEIYSICRGADGTIASSFNKYIKATRDSQGIWRLFTAQNLQEQYKLIAEGPDPSPVEGTLMGVFCQYTVSNASKFYFDDIYAGPVEVDTIPPLLIHIHILSDNSLSLRFNEALDSLSANQSMHYIVDHGLGNPVSAFYNGNYSTQVILSFDNHFEDDLNYLLTVDNISDLSGNKIKEGDNPFSNYAVKQHDVVINEIMADPKPVVDLPAYEYLEIYNTTPFHIDLTGWILQVGTAEKNLSEITLEPADYLIIADEEAKADLSLYGKFYGLNGLSLTNTGQDLILRSGNADNLSIVSYKDSWYKDPSKKQGGWSLEQVNPFNVCMGDENWSASLDPQGGTPGRMNSIWKDTLVLPKIVSFDMIADNILRISFNQKMMLSALINPENFQIEPEYGTPQNIYPVGNEGLVVDLYFQDPFSHGMIYQLTISHAVSNCLGMMMLRDSVISFGIGEEPAFNDIVLNEILFNPLGGGVDYVELYNRSNKIFDPRTLQLGMAKINPPDPIDTNYYAISNDRRLFLPGEYLLLTSSPEKVMEQYYVENPDVFITVQPFPNYANETGICLLNYGTDKLIDVLEYHEEMHFPLLVQYDGVALERLNPDSPTQDNRNWSSASEKSGFGTPGYVNSQLIQREPLEDPVRIVPEIFSPDNDGYHDTQGVHFTFKNAGYQLSI